MGKALRLWLAGLLIGPVLYVLCQHGSLLLSGLLPALLTLFGYYVFVLGASLVVFVPLFFAFTALITGLIVAPWAPSVKKLVLALLAACLSLGWMAFLAKISDTPPDVAQGLCLALPVGAAALRTRFLPEG